MSKDSLDLKEKDVKDLSHQENGEKDIELSEKRAGSDVQLYVRLNKEKALELLAENPNNVTFVCRSLGINRQTWYYHLKNDPDFAVRVQEIREACCDALEETMFKLGQKKSGFTFSDRIAYLRAHRPHLYNPTKRIIVEGYKMTDGEAERRSKALAGAVEAQIVNAYTTRKDRAQARGEGAKLLLSGDEAGGGKGA